MAGTFDIIAVTRCITGIAHTFIAKEALERAAAERGLSIKVEAHGQVGVEDELAPGEIAAAKAVVIAADCDVEAGRFEGKPLIAAKVSKALSVEEAGALIDRALAACPSADGLRGGWAALLADGPALWSNAVGILTTLVLVSLIDAQGTEMPWRVLAYCAALVPGCLVGAGIRYLIHSLRTKRPHRGEDAAGTLHRAELDRGAAAMLDGESGGASATEPAPATDFVKADRVFVEQGFPTRDEALSFLAAQAVRAGIAVDEDKLMEAFLAREAEGSTGMMDGFAIPHAKAETVREAAVMVLKVTAGVEAWETMDGQPVRVAIALLVPESTAGVEHLRLLSKVAEALMDEGFREAVRREADADVIAGVINRQLA